MNRRKKVGYAVLGRTFNMDPKKWGFVGGDDEPPLLLKDLAERNPDRDFYVMGRAPEDNPQDYGMPSNVYNPWIEWRPLLKEEMARRGISGNFSDQTNVKRYIKLTDEIMWPLYDELDDMIVWLGQHGTTNTPIPQVKNYSWDNVTKPQASFVNYSSFIVRGINYWRRNDPLNREEIYLIADARNYRKARDFKWPTRHPVIGQFEFSRTEKNERFHDTRTPEELGFGDISTVDPDIPTLWLSKQNYTYDRLEICGALPHHQDTHFNETFEGRSHFGLFINEARSYVSENRLKAMTEYIMPCEPAWVHGKWSDESLKTLGMDIQPVGFDNYWDKLRTTRTTFTTPSSGSQWATTKPWQAFAAGVVCFFHPYYDKQNHILEGAHPRLIEWLRVENPAQLKKRIDYVNQNEDTWRWLINAQREWYDKAVAEKRHLHSIERRFS